jgi:Na+-transporting NADH:ubiquinone oxidoreductase subunit C
LDKESNGYLVVFAVAVCVVCSASLALTFNSLKPRIDANEAFDRQRNVLKAVGYWNPVKDADKPRAELEQLFQDQIEHLVIDREMGEPVSGMSEAEIAPALKADEASRDLRQRRYLELYRATHPETGEVSFVLPTLAYGLWSWLYGFLAVNGDGTEVVGITYYKDGETPGLGGEINNANWQEQWKNKKLYDQTGELVGVTVKKGTVNQDDPKETNHYVDGLSGATITCNGVTKHMKWNLEAYEPFFRKLRE